MSPITVYIFRNLGKNRLITGVVLLSMIAVGVAVGSVGSILNGLAKAFSSGGHANRLLVVSRDADSEFSSVVTLEAFEIAKANAEVKYASPEVLTRSLLPNQDGTAVDPVGLRGLDPNAMKMHGYEMVQGREPVEGANELMVGENLHNHLPWLTVGGTVDILNEKFAIVGEFRSPTYMGGEAWTTRATFLSDPRRRALNVVYLETGSAAEAEAVIARLGGTKRLSIEVMSEPEFYKRMRGDHKNLVEALMLIFTLVMTGAIIVASSMLALVQRRRIGEYFTLRALGFRAFAIAGIVLWETELLAMVGGGLGLAAAFVVMRSFNINSTSSGGATINFTTQITLPLIAISAGLIFAVGLLGAVAPLVRVTRSDLTGGLRED